MYFHIFYFYEYGAGETLALVLLGVVVLEADLGNLLLLGAAFEKVPGALVELVTGHLSNGDF